MDSLDDGTCWHLFDYSFTNTPSTDFLWSNQRGRTDSCSKQGTKACREKLRRERLNDRHCITVRAKSLESVPVLLENDEQRTVFSVFFLLFLDLSSVLEPGRPTKTDKPAILDDAVRVLNQLKSETKELKETNEKLLEEIKSLKAEKNELREEKLVLKADKEKMEQQLKTMAMSPSGYMPAHPAAYQNKMAVFPGYSLVPMWNYLPPSTRDTSRDHELRPPAA
ncbi:Basic helix-loop-helix transcription factor [Parasponia andersonii]|uniref:Basic helix-loop-helix transcription factor n=1 Tax=Parasponia andersonii TaxID=3476 RepID=A0A2P5CSW5_PARAD|nr:Basic helix-loop-helix transcription factor [Parasponia andersonii]